MDVKRTLNYAPPTTVLQRPKTDRSEVLRPESSSTPARTTSTPPTNVGALVEAGKTEAMSQHQAMLDGLKRDIENGTYKADWDVVATRLGEALEAA
jgi:hypothetical protein